MIAGIVTRSVNAVERRQSPETAKKNHRRNSVIASLLFTLLAFGIAQFGLIPLVNRGYSYLGYVTMVGVAIPFVIHFIYSKVKKTE